MAPGQLEGPVRLDRTGTGAVRADPDAARLDDAVRRILRVKIALGLFEAGKPSQRTLGSKFELLGSPEHRAVAAALRASRWCC